MKADGGCTQGPGLIEALPYYNCSIQYLQSSQPPEPGERGRSIIQNFPPLHSFHFVLVRTSHLLPPLQG